MRIIHTVQRSKTSKKQREQRELLLKEQRAIRKQTFEVGLIPSLSRPPVYRDTPKIPSRGDGIGVAVKKEVPVYTGTAMIGIGQMHKSNAVPVFAQEEAESLAKMRR